MASFSDKVKEYSATPSGKIVVVAVPAALLVLIVAVVALTVLGSGGPAVDDSGVKPVESTGTASQGTTQTLETAPAPTAETTEPPINQDYEVYETRDPFKPADATETASSTSVGAASPDTSTAATASAQSNVLTLKSVTTQNGVLYANVDYGSNTYVVRAGERVGDSPYQVSSISSDSSTFLYGDDTLTLRVGEEVQK